MEKYRKYAVALAIVAVSVTGAKAQGVGQGPVADACKAEIEKFCAGKQHGGGEVRACLMAKKAELGAPCKAALETTGPGTGQGKAKGQPR